MHNVKNNFISKLLKLKSGLCNRVCDLTERGAASSPGLLQRDEAHRGRRGQAARLHHRRVRKPEEGSAFHRQSHRHLGGPGGW